MDAESRGVCFTPRQADVLQSRSIGASRLILYEQHAVFRPLMDDTFGIIDVCT